MAKLVETKASSILQFIHDLRGELHVTWEEGTWVGWLYDLLLPQVARVLVCDPRRDALLMEGNTTRTPEPTRTDYGIGNRSTSCKGLRKACRSFFPVGVFRLRIGGRCPGSLDGARGVVEREQTVTLPPRESASSDGRGAAIRQACICASRVSISSSVDLRTSY